MTQLSKEQRFLVLSRVVELVAQDIDKHVLKLLKKVVDKELSKNWDNREFGWFLLAESAACEKFAQEVKKQNEGF